MKRFIIILTIIAGMNGAILAQTADSTQQQPSRTNVMQKGTPTKRAIHQLKVLQEKLNLNEDQVDQVHMVLMNQAISLDSLKTNPSGNPKADRKSRREIVQEADQKINALLTDDQRKLYQQWKDDQKAQRMQKLNAAGTPPPPRQ
jgi:protein CpxP